MERKLRRQRPNVFSRRLVTNGELFAGRTEDSFSHREHLGGTVVAGRGGVGGPGVEIEDVIFEVPE